MQSNKPHKLKVLATENSAFEIWLDEKRIHHVVDYGIKKCGNGNLAELNLKLVVRFPIKDGE